MVMPAALSISVSASMNGMPSRAARRRPIDDLPAPIMPTSTTERLPSARWMRASGLSSACFGTAPLTIPSFQIVVTGSIYQQSGPPRGRPFRRLVASLPAGYSCFTPPLDAIAHAEPVPIPDVPRPDRRARLWRDLFAGHLRQISAARDHRDDPGGQVRQAALGAADGPPRNRRNVDRTLPRHAGGRARRA